jgi:hypothetical protein
MRKMSVCAGRTSFAALHSGAGKKKPAVFLFDDEFTTTQAAPLGTPRTCEPGPGSWAVTDTNNLLSVASGELVAGYGTIYNPQLQSVDEYGSDCGTGFFVSIRPETSWTTWLIYYRKP